jgi:hypothetical protein
MREERNCAHSLRVPREHDALGPVCRSPRKALPELLSDEGHDGVQKPQTAVEDGVEGVLSGATRLEGRVRGGDVLDRFLRTVSGIVSAGSSTTDSRTANATHNVDVANFVKPEAVDVVGGLHEVAVAKVLVDVGRGDVELVEDPALDERLASSGL